MKIIVLFLISCSFLFGEIFKPLTVLIDFPDYRYYDLQNIENELVNKRSGDAFTPELYSEMFFNPKEYTAYNGKKLFSARKYYDIESSGLFILEGTKDDIYGWYTAEKSVKFYGENISEGGDRIRSTHLIHLALDRLVEHKVDFSKYDLNNDGVIDSLMIIYAGKGEHMKNALGSNAIWPHFNRIQNITHSKFYYFKDHLNKTWKIDKYAFIPQDIPLDLYIHEIGHFLNLSDLYIGDSTIGYWSIMGELYCGEILGTKLNSLGGYHRYNLQNEKNKAHSLGFWAEILNYNLEDIKKKNQYVKLHNINHLKNNNLVKIDLPGKRIDVPTLGRDLYYTDNYLNPDNNITISTVLPKGMNNVLKFDTWFNSKPDKEIAKVYIQRQGEDRWTLIQNKTRTKDKRGIWIPLEFDLNQFNGDKIIIKVSTVPYKEEGPKGAYISNLMILSNSITFFDLKIDKNKIIHNDFTPSTGKDLLKKFILIEYRVPIDKKIDEGLLTTKLNIPYKKGLLVWYIDESYSDFNQLVSILSSNKTPVYEIVDGDLIKLNLNPYTVSTWTFSSLDTEEMGVIGEKRVFYRESIPGSNSFNIHDILKVSILEEDKNDIKFIISYKDN